MPRRSFTNEQLSAINTKGKTLLVSAAAGSGKTATLIERIIRSLLDEKNPEDISRILIVTFTNAAVDEIKERISKALRDAVDKNPENEALARQLMLLPTAKIRTIDGFCNDILRKNTDKAKIPPNYRIAEEAESKILSVSILEALINALYEDSLPEIGTAEDFSRLADALTSSKKNSELEEIFLKLYEKSKSIPEGVSIFKRFSEFYKLENPTDNQYTSYAVLRLHKALLHYKNAILRLLPELANPFENPAYSEIALSDISLCDHVLSKESYAEARAALSELSFRSLPGTKGEKSEISRELIYLHSEMRDEIREIRGKFFFYSDDEWRELFAGLHRELSTLERFLALFDKLYSEEKKKRAMLEYSDIERYTYDVLYENGRETDTARSIKEEFSSVYIDEYQDVNPMQNKIFDAVSTKTNRFMVGDIKQSIYSFRSADPEIFKNMKTSFPKLGASGDRVSVFMSRNFRSDKAVIDFTNAVFDKIFSLTAEAIGYEDADRLVFGKIYENDEPKEYRIPDITLVSPEKSSEDEERMDCGLYECELVAERISGLLQNGRLNNGESIKPSDIAIVMRSKSGMPDFLDALKRRGIPSFEAESRDFFLNAEVLLTLALLNAIDNPQKDIYLASVMLSPIFAFTPDEIYKVRSELKRGTLYDSVKAYCGKNPEFEKGKRLIAKLDFYRTLAEGTNIDTFILRLYNDTRLLSLAEKSGGKENLLLLLSYARKFSASKFQGLYNFIKFINNIISKKTKFDTKREQDKADAVAIMSIHASKGLEYPIVFYVDADASLADKDKRERIAFSEKFGLSLRLRSPGAALALVENPVHNIILDFKERKSFLEEERIIYVALTRARERLYIYAKIPAKDEEYLDKIRAKGKFLSENSIYSIGSAIELMLASGAPCDLNILKTPLLSAPVSKREDVDCDNSDEKELISKDELLKRLSFSYPHPEMTKLPEKLSVSKLYPALLDEEEHEEVRLKLEASPKAAEKRGMLPEFIMGKPSDESAKRGIATHSFMQFFSIDGLREHGAERELKALVEQGFLSSEDMERVRLPEILLFEKSALFREMKSAVSLYREFRFNTYLPARFFTDDKEKRRALADTEILVQGVIDCLYEDKNGSLHLVDYKTDRLTRDELLDKSLAAKVLREKHELQLSYYAYAIKNIFGKEPEDIKIYSTVLGECIDLKKRDFDKY